MKPFPAFIEQIWNSSCSGEFSKNALLQTLLIDGGLDTRGLNVTIISDLLLGNIPSDPHLVTFALSEVSSYYMALNIKMNSLQCVAACFAICILADCARLGEYEWSLEVNSKIIGLCSLISLRIELEDYLYMLCYVYGKGGQSPSTALNIA
jgi:hypothetical protein